MSDLKDLKNTADSMDVKIRERQRFLDMQEDQKLREGMEKEEEDIREYFSEMQKPIKEDPTLVRRKRYNEKMSTYRQAMAEVQLKNIYYQIRNFQGNTPEEQETLIDCKNYIKQRSYEGMTLCLAATSLISFYNRRYINKSGVLMGVVVGLVTGNIMGFLRSTQYMLQRFEKLGPDYTLGRMAIQEIADYRMDVKLRKPA